MLVCFDQKIIAEKSKAADTFEAIEVPEHGAGYAVHFRVRCSGCFMMPIIGERFKCMECEDVDLCRNCFFKKKDPKNHICTHDMEMILEPASRHNNVKCIHCKSSKLEGPIYSCTFCARLVLCKSCYASVDTSVLESLVPAHKPYHKFNKLK